MESSSSIFEAIVAPQRRAVCRYVAATDDTVVTLEEVATYVVTDEHVDRDSSVGDKESYRRVIIELHHAHFPKLADADVLQYDTDQNLARASSNLPVATELIQKGQNPPEDTTPRL